ncbi:MULTISPECIES: type IV pilus modification protein PilV [unclassified Acidovorax]|uniref:type IV pilus modification protein PilV n=1 Tax=unclassified Acidovorax TaxID=2684926 RepID=UPI002882EF5E|nr:MULTISPECIES: type IV pilus modification protein PilV [unclassified Acidovorax]
MNQHRWLQPSCRLPRKWGDASGFTLIEVLVAIVVLSFGMLGMVGVQAFALQANRDARLQSQAASLSRELAEMMRGNNIVAVKTSATDNPYLRTSSTAIPADSCLGVANSSSGCSTAKDVAESEMMDWLSRVNTALPGAVVVVCFDKTPYDSDGLPKWSCSEPTGSSDPDRIAMIKIGWTRNSLDRTKTGVDAIERADASSSSSRPIIVTSVTGGNPLSTATP